MRCMVMVKATKDSEAGLLPGRKLFDDMEVFNDELMKAGVLLAAEGLKASSHGVRVRFEGDQRRVVDGPFAETKELVAGFWLWQVRSLDEAIAWVRRCPPPFEGDGVAEIEIRPLLEEADFAALLTPAQPADA